MEKNKLTDEEIAQALLQNIEYSKTLTYFDKWGNHKAIMITDIIDFIHRLQKGKAFFEKGYEVTKKIIDEKNEKICKLEEEIERLKEVNAGLALANLCDLPPNEDCLTANEFEVARKTIAEQKAEIERLKKEKTESAEKAVEVLEQNIELQKKVENQKAELKAKDKAIEKEQAENKRLYDEYVRLDDFCAEKGCLCCICEKKKTCNECKTCGSLKTEKCNGFKVDVGTYVRAIERVGKLQKQVDELTDKLGKVLSGIKADELLVAKGIEQAVKDTAKDIATELLETKIKIGNEYYVFANNIKVIAKRKGVEVE